MFTALFVASCGGAGAPSPTPAASYLPATPAASKPSPSPTPSAAPTATPGATDDSVWLPAGSPADARVGHTATLMPNGRVLVAGGFDAEGANALGVEVMARTSAEVYDPVSNRWTATASMTIGRAFHTATLLSDGTVLVAGGGVGDEVAARSTELYDPATGRWTAVASMTTGRFGHTAFLLPDGRVLVAGGFGIGSDPDVLASTEVYDPSERSWTSAASLATLSYGQAGIDLQDGRCVLIQGGRRYQPATVTVYDPDSGRWSVIASMGDISDGVALARLRDGRVLAAGGVDTTDAVLASAQLFDPLTGTWDPAASMASERMQFTATTLLDGRVLVAGGGSSSDAAVRSTELYDPVTGAWSSMVSLADPRIGGTATLLQDGSVLVVGGDVGTGEEIQRSAERFVPSSD